LTPSVELIEPSEGSEIQGPKMRILGRVTLDGPPEITAGAIMKERNLEIVPFVKPITTTHLPAKKWWSQKVSILDESSGKVSGTVWIGDLQHGIGEDFRIILVIIPHGYVVPADTPYDDLPGVAVRMSNPRTVHRLS
jgi:hypothetical protein